MILPFPRLYLYGGLALALALGAWWVYRSGKEAGREAQKQESTQETKVQVEELRARAEEAWKVAIQQSKLAADEARARAVAAEKRESLLATQNETLRRDRQTALQNVGRIPDTQLHSEIVRTLALRPSGEQVACYLPSEERKILETLTDYPACVKQTQLQTEQIAEIRTQVSSLRDEVKAVEQQAQAEKQLRTRYAEFYATAYNLLRQKKRSPKCLWLFKCSKEPALSIPAPDAVK